MLIILQKKMPAMRNFVLDTVSQGRMKNIIYLIFEMDVTESRNGFRN